MKETLTILFFALFMAVNSPAQNKGEPVPLDLDRFVKSSVEKKAKAHETPSELKSDASKAEKNGDTESSTEVSIDFSRQYLSNGFGTWDEASIGIVHKFSKRKVLYASYAETERFDQRDRTAMIGFYQPLDEKWTLLVEAGASPTHRVLAKWSALAQVERSFGNGWIGQAGYRRTELDTAKVNIAKFGVEKYWGLNRAAYSFSVNNLEDTGTSASHRIQYNRYYGGELSSVGVSFAAGQEIENIGVNNVLQSDIYNLTLSGKHAFSSNWGFGYGYTHHKQGDIYSRRGLRLGLRYKF